MSETSKARKASRQMAKMLKAQKGFWTGFKDFIIKGNALSLAIGVIIGGAFQKVINSVVDDFLMPVINFITRGSVGTQEAFGEKFWDLTPSATDGTLITAQAARDAGHIVVTYGALVSAVLNFLFIGFAAFLIVRSLTSVGDLGKRAARRKKQAPKPEPTTKECPYCISEVSIKATRCPHCTSELEPEEDCDSAEIAAEEEAAQ